MTGHPDDTPKPELPTDGASSEPKKPALGSSQSAASNAAADGVSLTEIVRQTIELAGSASPPDNRYVDALAAVARRHRNDNQSVDQVAPELVTAALEVYFGDRQVADVPQLARSVAESICENPVSNERLSALWARLKVQ